jgi:AmiR/NasT family two-component response regulator
MPRDLGHLVGQADFEQARGVLMETHGYTADEALRAIEEFTHRTGTAVEVCVSMLRTSPTFYAWRVRN